MKMPKTIQDSLKHPIWEKELSTLRNILVETEMVETLKWGIPHYTVNNKNVVGIAGFKEHFALWFHQGVFLKDPLRVLVNAQEGTTKGLRQWRFTHADQINKSAIIQYVNEAILNQKEGLEIKAEPKKVAMPIELQTALENNNELSGAFKALTPGKRKEFADYIGSAKQEATRLKRLQKCLPIILEGKGLNDKYR
ncbi:MAG: YdeI/OmpD-associated family protein [Bacteroidetes bacterium]|nr:YdeI/OmpD-associated family protein [Bacteroidota bacterium]